MNSQTRKRVVRMLGAILFMCGEIGNLEYCFSEDESKEVVTVYDRNDKEFFSIHENWDDIYDLIIDVCEEVRRQNKIKSLKKG